jgi:AAA15 family ATPase/GTPase
MSKTEDPIHKAKILDLLKAADLGIRDIKLQKLDIDKLPKDLPKEIRDKILREVNEEKAEYISDVLTTHKKYDAKGKPIDNVSFSLDDDESSGTRKYFALTGPILDVIENGYTLVIDELDSKLHPNLVCRIVSLFNSKELNPKNAQLIFNTHDTNLLSTGLFRRDQIWFTDKNKYGEAKLYSLADFKSDEVKKSESFEDNYIRGKYGAVPFLGFFENLNNILSQYENEK